MDSLKRLSLGPAVPDSSSALLAATPEKGPMAISGMAAVSGDLRPSPTPFDTPCCTRLEVQGEFHNQGDNVEKYYH